MGRKTVIVPQEEFKLINDMFGSQTSTVIKAGESLAFKDLATVYQYCCDLDVEGINANPPIIKLRSISTLTETTAGDEADAKIMDILERNFPTHDLHAMSEDVQTQRKAQPLESGNVTDSGSDIDMAEDARTMTATPAIELTGETNGV